MTVDCHQCPLRRKEAFVGMTDEEVEFMRRVKIAERRVDPRTVVLNEGEDSRYLYTALEGLGLRYKTVAGGRRQVIGFTYPGDFIGLQGGLLGRMGHSFASTTGMTLCVFDRVELKRIYAEQAERAFDLTWLAATEESVLGEMLVTIGQRPAMHAMAWLLLRMFLRGRAVGLVTTDGAGGAMPFPYRQQDLADALGLSLVHTNKTMAKLRARDLAGMGDGLLRLPDLEALAAMAGSDLAAITPPRRPLF